VLHSARDAEQQNAATVSKRALAVLKAADREEGGLVPLRLSARRDLQTHPSGCRNPRNDQVFRRTPHRPQGCQKGRCAPGCTARTGPVEVTRARD